MTDEQIRERVLRVLKTIAPEADTECIDPDRRFRDQFDFDSVDFMNFALRLQEEFKVSIPEMECPRMATLNGCLAFLQLLLEARS